MLGALLGFLAATANALSKEKKKPGGSNPEEEENEPLPPPEDAPEPMDEYDAIEPDQQIS